MSLRRMGAVELQRDSFFKLALHGFECIAARSRDIIPEERSPGPLRYSETLDVVGYIHLLNGGSIITGLNFSG